MNLNKELKIQTIVLLAHKDEPGFSPGQFDKFWLNETGIIPAEEIKDDSNFSPNGAAIKSDRVNLVVLPHQVQLASTNDGDFSEIATQNCLILIDNIGDINLRGMGINFNWHISDEDSKIEELSKKLFYNKDSSITSKFDQEDAKYGMYLSKNITDDIRLKLDIRPVTITNITSKVTKEIIQFNFNFHSDLKSHDQKTQAKEILSGYEDLKKISIEILNCIA